MRVDTMTLDLYDRGTTTAKVMTMSDEEYSRATALEGAFGLDFGVLGARHLDVYACSVIQVVDSNGLVRLVKNRYGLLSPLDSCGFRGSLTLCKKGG